MGKRNNHFVPQCLLKGFASEGLYEWDKYDGNVEQRAIRNAAKARGFYPDELEDGLMREMDDRMGDLLHSRIRERRLVRLGRSDRHDLSKCLGLLSIRVPAAVERNREHVEEAKGDPAFLVDTINENADRAVDHARQNNPELYAELVDEFGEVATRQIVLETLRRGAADQSLLDRLDPHALFVQQIERERVDLYAGFYVRMQWTWLFSDHGFIIGDNPVCRWSRKLGNWDYGVARPDVEITAPMSQNICLRMTWDKGEDQRTIHCDRELTRKLNLRQLMSCTKKVYGTPKQIDKFCGNMTRRFLAGIPVLSHKAT